MIISMFGLLRARGSFELGISNLNVKYGKFEAVTHHIFIFIYLFYIEELISGSSFGMFCWGSGINFTL